VEQQSMMIMLMELVSPMEIHVHIFGPLLQPLMNIMLLLRGAVPVQTFTILDLQHSLLVSLGMIIFVILPQSHGNTGSTQMIPYGMELVVDQPTPAALYKQPSMVLEAASIHYYRQH
jgi:hypothetical protein